MTIDDGVGLGFGGLGAGLGAGFGGGLSAAIGRAGFATSSTAARPRGSPAATIPRWT